MKIPEDGFRTLRTIPNISLTHHVSVQSPSFLRASLVAQLVKNPTAMHEIWVQSLGWEDALEKGKATPILWPGEFHGLYSPWGRKESDPTE